MNLEDVKNEMGKKGCPLLRKSKNGTVFCDMDYGLRSFGEHMPCYVDKNTIDPWRCENYSSASLNSGSATIRTIAKHKNLVHHKLLIGNKETM